MTIYLNFEKYVWIVPLSPIKIPITLKCSILNFTYDLSVMWSEEVTNKINYLYSGTDFTKNQVLSIRI